jgi:GGDEF domain-containing protein
VLIFISAGRSIGVAYDPLDGETASALFIAADKAMYEIKYYPVGGIVFYWYPETLLRLVLGG